MIEQLNPAIARIRTPDRRVMGAGFLVSARHVLTCAHVVQRALGLPQDTPDAPPDPVTLDFPLRAPGMLYEARVVRWDPKLDVAGLALPSSLPDAVPAPLIEDDALWDHAFGACGFPAGRDDGVWTRGVLRGPTGAGWVQIDGGEEPGYWVAPGFSGTAIWDTALNGVVGMAVSADRDPAIKAAYMVPVRALLAAWPELIETVTPVPRPVLNPFCDRGRINDPARLFDRHRTMRELRQMLAVGNHVSLVGTRQVGKSSVLYALYATAAQWLPDKRVHYIDMQEVIDEEDFCAEVLEGIGHEPGDLRALKRALRRASLVLLLDEVEKLTRPAFTQDLHELLRGLAQRPTLTLAMASYHPLIEVFPPESKTSPLHNVFTQKRLGPFTGEDARRFLRARLRGTGVTFAAGEIERLVLESGGHPAKLQRLAYQLFNDKTCQVSKT